MQEYRSALYRMRQRESNRSINRDHVLGRRKLANLRSIADVHEKIGYIHQNPVRRGLIEKPGDWPWSSWRAWHLGVDEPIRIDRGTLPLLKKR